MAGVRSLRIQTNSETPFPPTAHSISDQFVFRGPGEAAGHQPASTVRTPVWGGGGKPIASLFPSPVPVSVPARVPFMALGGYNSGRVTISSWREP
jgi:hypothetical protein